MEPPAFVGARGFEKRDTAADIVGRHDGVGVEADDDFALGGGDGAIECDGRDALGIIDDVEALIASGGRKEKFAGAVDAHAVGDDDFEAVVIAGEDRREAALDEAGFVAAGNDDRYEGRHLASAIVQPVWASQ